MECGGKRSATPLWICQSARSNQSAIAASLCRRTPNLRCETTKCWF
jgi:hypothetical protein